jgi:hypothetical protein
MQHTSHAHDLLIETGQSLCATGAMPLVGPPPVLGPRSEGVLVLQSLREVVLHVATIHFWHEIWSELAELMWWQLRFLVGEERRIRDGWLEKNMEERRRTVGLG